MIGPDNVILCCYNYYYYYYYYFTSCEFFIPMLAGGLSLESEWLHAFSGLQDSSEYSNQSQQCSRLNGLNSSSDFQFHQSFFQAFGGHFKFTNYNWHHHHPYVTHFFYFPDKYLSIFLLSFIFTLLSSGMEKSTRWQVLYSGL